MPGHPPLGKSGLVWCGVRRCNVESVGLSGLFQCCYAVFPGPCHEGSEAGCVPGARGRRPVFRVREFHEGIFKLHSSPLPNQANLLSLLVTNPLLESTTGFEPVYCNLAVTLEEGNVSAL